MDVETLVAEYGKAIYGLCRKLTQNAFDADDLYQQTFLTALGKEFRREENPKAFLTKICLSHYENTRRKYARRQRIAPVTEAETERISSGEDLEKGSLERELKTALRKAVEGLAEKYRIPVLLYYAMDLSLKEIAGCLKIPEGTVKSRLSTARKLLREELEVNGFDR